MVDFDVIPLCFYDEIDALVLWLDANYDDKISVNEAYLMFDVFTGM